MDRGDVLRKGDHAAIVRRVWANATAAHGGKGNQTRIIPTRGTLRTQTGQPIVGISLLTHGLEDTVLEEMKPLPLEVAQQGC